MKNVLVVDDAMFMQMTLQKILEGSGRYKVIATAKDGEEALNQYKMWKPDIVTMDITMEGMDGLTAVEMIRQYDPDAKIVMVSAMGQQDKVVEAINLGAMNFIVKPFEPERVLAALDKLD